MAKIKQLSDGSQAYRCPGCGEIHNPNTEGNHRWTYNGDPDKPTFIPSILVRSGHYAHGHQGDCWCTYGQRNQNEPSPYKCFICHSFVTDGKIQFLSDCTHKLAGQTVEIPDWED